MGRIGERYARLVHGLRAQVVYASPTPKPEAERDFGAKQLELFDLLETSDVVSIHAPATPETRRLIGPRELEAIGPTGVLVNTSRGSLVDSEALASALESDVLGAAGLDVYENEPDVPQRLLEAPRCVLLPHIGSATVSSRDAMARAVAENVIAVLEGREPPSRVA
jgi:glyoxylate reductase